MVTPPRPTFALFPHLAPELRIQIYQNALPANIPPTLYPYKRGCWQPFRANPTKPPEYDANGEELDLCFNFRDHVLDPIPYSCPLAFVCHEAREVVLTWAAEHGLEVVKKLAKRQKSLFLKPFNSAFDILYVPHDEWAVFAEEADERQFEPDLLDQSITVEWREARLAIPEALVRLSHAALIYDLQDLLERWWGGVNILFIVVDPQPEFSSENGDAEMEKVLQSQWGIEAIPGARFVWNLERARFDLGVEEFRGDMKLYGLIEEACKELGEGFLTKDKKNDFEIRLVKVITR